MPAVLISGSWAASRADPTARKGTRDTRRMTDSAQSEVIEEGWDEPWYRVRTRHFEASFLPGQPQMALSRNVSTAGSGSPVKLGVRARVACRRPSSVENE